MDQEARKSYFGYKAYVSADVRHKLVRKSVPVIMRIGW